MDSKGQPYPPPSYPPPGNSDTYASNPNPYGGNPPYAPPYAQPGPPGAYPPQSGNPVYPPQGGPQAYPPPGQAYPQQGGPQGYPPQGGPQAYPPQGGPQTYPPQYNQNPAMYPPPNQAVNPLMFNPPTTVIQTNIVPVNTIFGPYSIIAYCKHCNQNVSTKVERSIGCMVWLMCLIFCLVSPIISCVPFCCVQWYDASHYCPKCSHKIGQFSYV